MSIVKIFSKPIQIVLYISIILLFCSSQLSAAEITIKNPSFNGYRLDYCREWGKNCGRAAANSFCKAIGHNRTSKFLIDKNIGKSRPTRIVNGGQICKESHCDGFKFIRCKLKGVIISNIGNIIPKAKKQSGNQGQFNSDKEDSTRSHFMPGYENDWSKFEREIDSSIKAIAKKSSKWSGSSLLREIEKACVAGETGGFWCLYEKQVFLKKYLSQ